jgi:hypothetical protein
MASRIFSHPQLTPERVALLESVFDEVVNAFRLNDQAAATVADGLLTMCVAGQTSREQLLRYASYVARSNLDLRMSA